MDKPICSENMRKQIVKMFERNPKMLEQANRVRETLKKLSEKSENSAERS